MKQMQNKKVSELKDRGKTMDTTKAGSTNGFAAAKTAQDGSKASKFGLKIAPQRENTMNFKNEPRD